MSSNTQGVEFLRNPSVNKATAYTETEKQSLGLVGLVPDVTETIDTQLSRVLWHPIEKHECLPQDAYAWSNGKAIYAGGVQFPPVHHNGETFLPSQANNLYVFPAVGMAIYATSAKRVTDEMFIEAAHAVADQVRPGSTEARHAVSPAIEHVRDRNSNRSASGKTGL
jgi:Malic enzyme, NAD binding domain